jgi:type I restriction enzyme S subunit
MTSLFPIPDSWVWTTLGEIANVVGGVTKDSKKQSDTHIPQVPYLRVANVQRGYLDLSEIALIRVPEPTVTKLRLRPGDVLLNEGGDRDKLGRGWIWQGQIPDCIHQNHVFRVRLTGAMDPKLLAWYANEVARDWFEQNASQSVNLASISLSTIKRLPVPLPPAEEQRRIAAAIEEHFSRLDSSIASVHSALDRIRRLRLRLLTDSVTDTDKTWDEYVVGQVIKSARNGMYISRPAVEPDGVPILRIGSVRALQLNLADIRYSGRNAAEINRQDYLLEPGDLLFTRYNGNPDFVGACAVVPGGIGALTYPDKLIRVRTNKSYVLPEYLALTCSAGESRSAIRQFVKTTAGQSGISGRELKNVPIRLPKLEEQKRRVQQFTENHESLQRLEASLVSGSRKASELRRSILHEAFAGRLVRQDAADEPVMMLLEHSGKAGRSGAKIAVTPGPEGEGAMVFQREALF